MSEAFVHASSFVDEGAVIGDGTRIWHFCHVMSGARLGRRCSLGQNVFVASGVEIGDDVKIQNNVSLYTGTIVEDDVFLGPSAVFTNVTNPRAAVVRQHLYETTRIGRGATIGANATVVCGVTIGKHALVGAGAVVTRSFPNHALVLGVPARQAGWVSRHGHRLVQADENGVMTCPESGLRYRVESGGERLACLDLDDEAPLPDALRRGLLRRESYRER